MKIISNKLNLNIHDIIKACETKEFGFKPFLPGPEFVDIVYLSTQF